MQPTHEQLPLTKSISLNPDLVRKRCLYARTQLACMSAKRAAKEMGYHNTSMISKMERLSSKTAINILFIMRASVCYGVSADYLLGMTDYPEREVRSVEQLAVYRSTREYVGQIVGNMTEAIIKGANSHQLADILEVMCTETTELLQAIHKMRELDKRFDNSIKGGSSVIRHAQKIEQRIVRVQARLAHQVKASAVAFKQFNAVLEDSTEQMWLDLEGFNGKTAE